MTNASLPDMRPRDPDDCRGDGPPRRRGRYLPSAQVLAELTALGPDLTRLAADLRDRLSDEATTPAT